MSIYSIVSEKSRGGGGGGRGRAFDATPSPGTAKKAQSEMSFLVF